MAHNIHIVGTVPLADNEAVFTALATLGEAVKRMPDGETGPRTSWLAWLDRVFDAIPQLERSDELWRVHEQAVPQQRRKLKAGASVEDIRFASLPMGDFARDSYAVFRRLREQGKIRAGTKFQVDFAPAHSAVRSHVVDALVPALEPVYNDAICREVGRIAAAIPHQDLAIQFDVASAVFAVLQRGDFQSHGRTKEEAAANFAAILTTLGNSVPGDVDLLFHFCYGDNNHRHSVEPKDMGDMVDMANRLRRALKRPAQLIHMPVPRDRDDDAYFAPLVALDRAPETEIALGLVHMTGGLEGIKRRMATARRYLPRFAIATECGFGRRDPATIPALLRLHAEAAALP
ncbi:MAG TPA: hypothetical protein VKV32_04965 [Stellaceae bacterium]|nr:hypothetical protein [Stellaceae bacterium]